ncbi:hypothetical protein CEXT_624561, partial [Caerostris extrusa]
SSFYAFDLRNLASKPDRLAADSSCARDVCDKPVGQNIYHLG